MLFCLGLSGRITQISNILCASASLREKSTDEFRLNSTGVQVLCIGFAMRSKRKLQGKQRAIVRKRFLRHETRRIQHHGA